MVGDYQDPAFQTATIAAFPLKANATVEEARVLWKLGGYDRRAPAVALALTRPPVDTIYNASFIHP